MGIGLITLSSYSIHNKYLVDKPKITFFKIIYKRYSYFNIEEIPISFSNPLDFNTSRTITIPKNADLLWKMYLQITLPYIYAIKNVDGTIDAKYKLCYVENFIFKLIEDIQLEIDNTLINYLKGNYLYTRYKLTSFVHSYDKVKTHIRGLESMLGNVSSLLDLTNYKESYTLYFPLDFWFCRSYGSALPLSALKENSIKLHVKLNSLEDIVMYGPTNYVLIQENIVLYNPGEYLYQSNNSTVLIFFHFESIVLSNNTLQNRLYYNIISGKVYPNIYITSYTNHRFSCLPISLSYQTNVNYNLNSYTLSDSFINCNYIFLDGNEQLQFAKSEHHYLIDNVEYYYSNDIYGRQNRILLGFKNPCIELLWTIQYYYLYKVKQYFNYLNDISSLPGPLNLLLTSCKLTLNGVQLEQLTDNQYYSDISIYNHHTNYNEVSGIYLYSFSLNPEDSQPSGALNMSMIENLSLEFTTNSSNINNKLKLHIYSRYYNYLVISNNSIQLLFDEI